VKKGESVGYGRTHVAAKDIVVASVPIGYADGVSRKLSNKGKVLINGHLCNIVGNICMDQFMVDVTGIPVQVKDEVVVIGKSGEHCLTVEDVAEVQGTIDHEVVTSLSLRIPTHYV
jgi:alanine racemase